MRLTLPRLAALAAAGAIGASGGVGIYSALQDGGTTTVIREMGKQANNISGIVDTINVENKTIFSAKNQG